MELGTGFGVADGTRTRDNRNHNPGLYQLSYSHHTESKILACFKKGFVAHERGS